MSNILCGNGRGEVEGFIYFIDVFTEGWRVEAKYHVNLHKHILSQSTIALFYWCWLFKSEGEGEGMENNK